MQYEAIAVHDLVPGDNLEGFYIINNPVVKSAANGKPFLSCSIADCSGSVDAKMWDYTGSLSEKDSGTVVKVRAEVTEFKGAAQLRITRLRFPTPEDSYDVSRLVPTAPIDADRTLQEVRSMLAGLPDADYRAVAEVMLGRHLESFASIPAAKSVHHGFLHGLLMHTASMMRLADFMAAQYPDVIDRSLLVAGTFLHDLAKEREFTFSALGLATDYSVSGQLLGHLVMGAQEVSEVCNKLNTPEEKSLLLQHLILSHHGDPEFGAAVTPRCAEAELLSYIDRVDSRMEIYREVLADVAPGEFSGKVFALDGKRLYRHELTNSEDAEN